MVELVGPLGVPDTTPVEELMLKLDGNEGEIVKLAGPPVFVTVRFVIAVPAVALIVEVDKAIDGAFTYLTITTPDPPAPPETQLLAPPPPLPVFATPAEPFEFTVPPVPSPLFP